MFHFPAYPRNNKVPCRPMTAGGLPHSEILGSKPCWRLPEAYRILKRPSSVLSAKASTIRPSGRHTPRKNPNDSFKRQTTNHHTVKNDHKTIDLETRLQKKKPGEIAIKQTMTSHHRIARVHYPVLKPPRAPTGPDPRPARPTASRQGHPENRTHPKRMRVAVREPKSISAPLPARPQGPAKPTISSTPARPRRNREPSPARGPHDGRQTGVLKKLRRKEVIQPHLPVRLPCYDLVPITSLTLDGSIHKGLGHRLRVLPTFMT